ncbi:MAG TPA: hypothetical protein DCP92_05795 [Nitrospiraceae bacterium]|jgi:uncharacterized protein YneF (UPF0154 family)|nr:hypothetical protein [Nitrospiraceae bacterium]
MKKWQAIVGVILVFLLGAVAGALVTHSIYQNTMEKSFREEPRSMREFIVQRMNHELQLDPAQLEQLRSIIKETHAEIRTVRKQISPQIEEILARSEDKVRVILRPDQLEKFDKIVARRKKKREESR